MCIWTIFGVKIENPKIRKKGSPKLGEGAGPPVSELKLAPRPPIGLCPNCPPKLLGGGDMGPQNLNFGPHLPKIGESPGPKFGTFGKPLGRATSPENFVGQSS